MSRGASLWRWIGGYFAMACLASWVVWAPLVATAGTPAASSLRYLHLLGSLGPAMSAFCMAWLRDGRRGAGQLAAAVMHWRVGWAWWLAAVVGPFLALLIAQMFVSIMGGAVALGVISGSREYPDLPFPVYAVAVLVFYGFGEEIGWRGFALPCLQRRFHPFVATLAVTAIWALWHAPLFFFTPGMMSLGLGGAAGWLFSLVTGSFLLTLLHNRTGGSVLIVACFHAAMDLAFLGPPEVMNAVGAVASVAGLAAAWIVARSPRRGLTDPASMPIRK